MNNKQIQLIQIAVRKAGIRDGKNDGRYRLLLSQDNAGLRLSPIGYEVGLLAWERYEAVEKKREAVEGELKRLKKTWLAPSEEVNGKLIACGFDPLDDGVNGKSFLEMRSQPPLVDENVTAIG